MTAIVLPISLKSTWATNTDSPSPDGIGESHVTTFVPAVCAAAAVAPIVSPALLDIMTTLKPSVGAVVRVSILALDAIVRGGARERERCLVLQFGFGLFGTLVPRIEWDDA